ncbi:M-phase phosphoprotein 6 [Quillaja saponaria]|nr:M-phase phosphoprotein 6 [Quillaja saponaria]
MQRATLRDEKTKKEEEVKPDGNFSTPNIVSRKCIVLIEGDPHPGALKGRMPFQSFNPSIDKLNGGEENICKLEAPMIAPGNQITTPFREDGSSTDGDGAKCSNLNRMNYESSGNLKRKQSKVVSEAQYPNKSPKNGQDGHQASPKKNSLGSFRKPKSGKLDWSVLQSSKSLSKRS